MNCNTTHYRANSSSVPGDPTHAWDEIGYVYDKLLYWLYQREDAGRARPYALRLEHLLRKADPGHEAIFGEECWSLIYETREDLRKAIKHREKEISLIRRLYEITRDSPNTQAAREGYDYGDLSDRLDLLASLYHDLGCLDQAIAILQESKGLCQTHGIPFDGADLLEEFLREKGDAAATAARSLASAKKRTAS